MASVQEYADSADVVVLGAVEEVVSETGAGHQGREGVVRLRVDRVLKGAVPTEIEVVNGNCNGAALAAEQRGVFFLARDGKELRADLCGGSGFVKPKQVLAALGEGASPDAGNPPGTGPVVIDRDEPAQSAVPLLVVLGAVTGLALAAVATAVAVRKRRS